MTEIGSTVRVDWNVSGSDVPMIQMFNLTWIQIVLKIIFSGNNYVTKLIKKE